MTERVDSVYTSFYSFYVDCFLVLNTSVSDLLQAQSNDLKGFPSSLVMILV